MKEQLSNRQTIAVIGAGVVGLSTAVCIQKEIPSATVTLLADKFGKDTLSDGAGGLFRPELSIDADKEKVLKWCISSLKHFSGISTSVSSGVSWVPGYHISSSLFPSCDNPLLETLFPVHKLAKNEMKQFPSKFKHGNSYTTIIVDCRYYLSWLQEKFQKAGGTVKKKHINNFFEIPDEYNMVVNCTGLGAKGLIKDHRLIPIRGQTIKVKAPWIDHFYFGDEVYIIPGQDYVTLGGVKDYNSWNMEINPYQKQFIWDRCLELVPSLRQAEFKWDWVGLRPYRPEICLESTIVCNAGKSFKVVNNYGHGGNGVTLSWGTAEEATNLVKQALFVSKL